MKLAIFASALSYVAAASSSNPFAPAATKNTAKATLNAKLLRHATPLRRLEDNADDAAAWALDLSTYSLKFEKCQFVKQYAYAGGNNNNKNNNNNGGDILTTKHFVVFRLCPDHGCESCNYKYGEYIIDLESYLEATLQYKSQVQENYCQSCNQCIEAAANGNADGGRNLEDNVDCSGIDTSTCYTECQNIENMEANGYVDASEYTGCVKLNSYDANGNNYYAGPVCGSSGTSGTSRIKIGVFTDEACMYYDDSLDISTMLVSNDGVTMSLSYHLLKETFADGKCIASCLAENNNNNNNNNNGEEQAAEVNELCQQLYETSGKCEQTHGFADGMKAYDEETNYEQQELNEELVCNFITAVKSGAYDLSGEIVVTGGKASVGGGTTTTGMQKFTLTFFILGTVALAGYAAMMHSQLTKGAKADLSRQGGAMA
jgi:hypothetical protein